MIACDPFFFKVDVAIPFRKCKSYNLINCLFSFVGFILGLFLRSGVSIGLGFIKLSSFFTISFSSLISVDIVFGSLIVFDILFHKAFSSELSFLPFDTIIPYTLCSRFNQYPIRVI